jgi:hypothetical protein
MRYMAVMISDPETDAQVEQRLAKESSAIHYRNEMRLAALYVAATTLAALTVFLFWRF